MKRKSRGRSDRSPEKGKSGHQPSGKEKQSKTKPSAALGRQEDVKMEEQVKKLDDDIIVIE